MMGNCHVRFLGEGDGATQAPLPDKSGDRYHSITYPQGGFEILQGKRLHLSKIGQIKIKLHREMKGKVKTCIIKREGEQWYAILTCEYTHDPSTLFHPSEEEIGVDLGVKVFAMLSTGEPIENPHRYQRERKQLLGAGSVPQRPVSSCPEPRTL